MAPAGETPEAARSSPYDAAPSGADRVSLRQLPAQLLRAIRLVWEAARNELVSCVLLEVAAGISLAGQLLVGRSILDAIVAGDADTRSLGDLAPDMLALAALSIVVGFCASALVERQYVMGELVERHVQDRIIEVVTAVDLEAFDRPAFYDRLRRAKVNASERSFQIVVAIVSMSSAVVGLVALAAVLLSIQPAVLPLVLLASVPLWIATRRNGRATYEFSFEMTPADRERAYLQGVLTGLAEAKELRLFGLAGFLRRRYDRLYDDRLHAMRSVVRRRMRRSLLGSAGSTAVTVLGVLVLLQLTLSGRISAADAAVAAVAVQQLGARLRGINGGAGHLHESGLFLADLVSFLDLQAAVATARPIGDAPAPFSRLAAERVSFAYPGTTRSVLNDVCIEIGPGEIVALVGRNGSGKTTLAKLLCGLYQPSSGRVSWNDVDVATCDPVRLRRQMTAIFQDFVHYELPARDNVGLGDWERIDDLQAVERAAQAAGADRFLARLPEGYDTRLSRAFEGGTELSMGQWQRIALARAFFRDAPVLILDEPTAALDAQAEHELFDSIRSLKTGRAVLLISHRFSSVRSADRIYVLEQGRVVEAGTHDELFRQGGRYAELFSLQASAYLDTGLAMGGAE